MQAQPTGYPQQQQQQQLPMGMQPTGYPMAQPNSGMMGGLGPQPTGMMGGGGGLRPPMMMGPPQPQRFMGAQPTGMPPMGLMPPGRGPMSSQPTGYPAHSPSGFLGPQPTGYMGAQPTGMPMDPRMQLMSAQFLPSSTPFSGAPIASNMNFSNASMQPANFQNQIQNLSQQQQGSREPKIPWALSKEEKKSYDAIFRAWDQQGTGFISGDVAREVFGQSGLDRDGLMQVWHLSDTENRGKLNLAEFHVAMGLIYRALNGNDMPNELPAELIPPSSKQLSESVDFVKDLLKRDTIVRNSTALNLPEAGSNRDARYGRSGSLFQNPVERRQDATAYKHEDSMENGGYRSSSRHLDRKAVRWGGEGKDDDLSEMKRQLANTQKMLDEQDRDVDSDDREIAKEMDDLRFRIRRVQDDIEYYNRRGGRDAADQRRKAERELMHLTHERLPQLEKRMEESDKRKRDRKAVESRDRDRYNSGVGRSSPYSSRYGDSDRDYDRGSTSDTRGEYLRGSFDRDEPRDSARAGRDRRDDRREESAEGPTGARSPAQASARESATASVSASPAPSAPRAPEPAPIAAPASASTAPKGMTPEERQAWIRSEAQRRIQERMRALGASAPSAPGMDSSVEDRLRADREEAEARSARADQEAAAREEARRARLEEQKLSKDKAAVTAVKAEINAEAEKTDAPAAAVTEEARRQVGEEEEMIRRREQVLAKEKAEREARFKKLEEEEAEARRQEEAFKERQSLFSARASPASSSLPAPSRKKGGPPPPPPTRNKAAPAVASSAPPPPTPPALPAMPSAAGVSSPATSPVTSTNPFHRMQTDKSGGATPGSQGSTNPFFRQQQQGAAPPAATIPSTANSDLPAPARPAGNPSPSPAATVGRGGGSAGPPRPPADDDWEESDKSGDEDEDDGPGTTTRATRQNLAQALFSGMVPNGSGSSGRSTPVAASPAPVAPAAATTQPSGGPPPPPPAPPAALSPSAPAAPPAPAFKAPTGPVDRSALLSQIQGGARLRKATTRDTSGPPGAGKVIGDASPPVQKFVPPPSPPQEPATAAADPDNDFVAGNMNRQSVDWAQSLAADHMTAPKASVVPDEPSVREEPESDGEDEAGPEDPDGPSLAVRDAAQLDSNVEADSTAAVAGDVIGDAQEDFDLSTTIRVRTLYPYSGQRDEDLSFNDNEIILAHPGKDGALDWMYGTMLTGASGKKGQFPRAYVAELSNAVTARALYAYSGSSPDEADFAEGDEVRVVDQEDASWWKVEQGDAIKIAPATYLELSG
ncbi:unnamed protein product [Parajaminaea phylloscopi]